MPSEHTADGGAQGPGGGSGHGSSAGALRGPGDTAGHAGTDGRPGRPGDTTHPHPAYPPHQAYGPYPARDRQSYAQLYQQDFWGARTRIPLPEAPVWLPLALLGVGVVAAFLATLDRPGLGIVITGAVAGLTALTALMVRPPIPDGAPGGADGRDEGPDGNASRALPEADAPAAREADGARAPGTGDAVPGGEDGSPRSGETRPDASGSGDTGGTESGHDGSGHADTGCAGPGSSEGPGPEHAQETGDTPAAGTTGAAEEAEDAQETGVVQAPEDGSAVAAGTTGAAQEAGDARETGDAEAQETGVAQTQADADARQDGAEQHTAADTGTDPSGPGPTRTGTPDAPAPAPDTGAAGPAAPPAPVTARGGDAGEPRPDRYAHAWSAGYGVIAAALLLTAVLRDAGWVLFWTLTSSFFFASLAFSVRNPSSREGAVGVVSGSLGLFRNLPSTPLFLVGPLRSGRGRRLAGPVLLTTLVTGALLLVFGLLFSFADAVFASYIARLFEGAFSGSTFFDGFSRLFAMLAAVLFTGSAVLAARRRRAPGNAPARPAGAGPASPSLPVWVWTIPLGALVALFTAFLGVQAVAMFGGDDHVQRVAGVTYAEYARQGFFQLVVVSLLVLCVIAVAVYVLPSRPAATRTLRNALLGLLCVLTLVILASAMMRLQLYIDAFGLTRLRISAEAWIVWSAGVFGLVIAAGVLNTLGRRAAWLPRGTAALAGVALAVFAYGNPDLRIAESHHDLELTQVDTWYLRDLSADALPALVELEGGDRACALSGIAYRLDDAGEEGLASWNLSRHRGRAQLAQFAQTGPADGVTAQEGPCRALY
ncbi:MULTISPECIES: DUF4153 domain-containing protein [Nocardiopsidaceae]|uniref:DUF4173 domain-containing protein n=1 Tax=Streptomonospora nanhaiensis TaxID=1323731 RepID=A0ABY6YJP3_9ACTN|nr:DUF4153 domain-containing protein [Streptomonospora nanhaiensis]WAE72438.1 DUF4173 domain-containing protein [Streptomonospora nanhaiensis]